MQYTSQQLWQKYQEIPDDLREALWSQENSEAIYNIAKENNTLDFITDIAFSVGRIFLGILPPKEYPNFLSKEVGLEEKIAVKIAQQIDEQIFSKVRRPLFKLYEKPEEKSLEERLKKIEEKIGGITETPQTKVAPSQDVYREPIELKK